MTAASKNRCASTKTSFEFVRKQHHSSLFDFVRRFVVRLRRLSLSANPHSYATTTTVPPSSLPFKFMCESALVRRQHYSSSFESALDASGLRSKVRQPGFLTVKPYANSTAHPSSLYANNTTVCPSNNNNKYAHADATDSFSHGTH